MGAIQPFFNARGGDIFLVPAFGGNSVKIADNGYYPAWSPDGKQIAYQSDRDGSWRLWTVSAHGGEPQKLTNNPGDSFQPSWSSDGKWIVYMSRVLGFNISVVASTGGIPRKLLATDQPAFRPAWGQDGKSIIFSTNKSGAINLWSIPFFPSDDTPAEPWDRVTFGEGSDANVTVSSVGNKIAFSTLRTTLDIWELTLSSGKLRQVTFETSSEDYPQLSPDGSTLLVVSDRGGKSNIWLMDLNGKVISQMSSQTGLAQPRWSPNGKTIVWSLSFEGRSSIVTQNLGEASLTEVVSDSGASSPSWSPDGNQLAFSFITNGFHNIFVWTLQKHELRQLTFFESTTLSPSWSPDGKHITFQSNDKKGRHLWIAPARGGSPTQMTFGDSEDSHPQWSPRDKDVILFLRDHKNLFLLSVNTKKVRQITNFVEANILTDYPSWSFDGKKIYFSYLKKAGDVYVLENY